MATTQKLESLEEQELKVVYVLYSLASDAGYNIGDCYFGHSAILGGEGLFYGKNSPVHDKKELSKILKKLRELGFVKYARGLMNEDGELAGSGNTINEEIADEAYELFEEKGWIV